MSVANQISILYAGVNGYLDNVGIENINQYEKELVEYLAANNQDMLNNIASSGKLDDSNEKELQSTLDSFTKTFNS